MINAKLDTKFNDFLQDSKQKIKDLGKEIELLNTENIYIEQQVSGTFHNNSELTIELKKFEDQLKRFKELHCLNTDEYKALKLKVDKAKKDFENLTSAFKSQTDLVQKEKKMFMDKEKDLRFNRRANEDMFKSHLTTLEYRIEQLTKEKELKMETNNAYLADLNNSENIEADILTSIKAEMMSLSSMSSSSFFKTRKK